MLKRFFSLLLVLTVLLSLCAGAAADDVSTNFPCTATPLSTDVVKTLLGKLDSSYSAIYEQLLTANNNDPECLPAMNFSVNSEHANYDSFLSAYSDWIVHFTLTPTRDMTVILLGQYDTFGDTPVPLPAIDLKANDPFRVMDFFWRFWIEHDGGMDGWDQYTGWPGYYEIIAKGVSSFNCLAIPYTESLKTILENSGASLEDLGLSGKTPVPDGSILSIGLSLYPPTENGVADLSESPLTVITKSFGSLPGPSSPSAPSDDSFVSDVIFNPTFQFPAATVPQTGDSFTPVLYLALAVSGLLGAVMLKKRAMSK